MMSGFNLEEFKRGVPAIDREGHTWVFENCGEYGTRPIRASCAHNHRSYRFAEDGRHDSFKPNVCDLIAMQYQDMDEDRADTIGQNSNEGLHYDAVNHPKHYLGHPSGIECIQITEHMGFNLGNATKYIWRADLKGDAIEDLKKAAWYINREIEKREKVK